MTFEQKSIDTYQALCGDAGIKTFKELLPDIKEAYPIGPNGEGMHMALRVVSAIADAASYQRIGNIDRFLIDSCPRLPEGFKFTPQEALSKLEELTQTGLAEAVGVRGISAEALARILRQGGIAPRYISGKWQIEFTPCPEKILAEAKKRDSDTSSARWKRGLTDLDAIEDNRTFAKTNTIIAELRRYLPLTFEFDANGVQQDICERATAYEIAHHHLNGTEVVQTYEPNAGTRRLAKKLGIHEEQLAEILRTSLDREGVQVALNTGIFKYRVELLDTGTGTAVIMPGNRILPLNCIKGVEFMGVPLTGQGRDFESEEHREIVAALEEAARQNSSTAKQKATRKA